MEISELAQTGKEYIIFKNVTHRCSEVKLTYSGLKLTGQKIRGRTVFVNQAGGIGHSFKCHTETL